MYINDYHKAQKIALAQQRNAVSRNGSPFPLVLEDITGGNNALSKQYLGIMEIPLALVMGTVEASRSNAFSYDFMPLLSDGSEFASKWVSLFGSQLEEGLREPIVVYEYMHVFYVEEGNKRVSVMKYLKSPTIMARVTRIIPPNDDSSKLEQYHEFLEFYEKTKIWSIVFSKPGDYARLVKCVGKEWDESWSKEEINQLRAVFHRFVKAYGTIVNNPTPEQTSVAFLECLLIFTFDEWKYKTISEMKKNILLAREELDSPNNVERVEHIVDPIVEKKHLGIAKLRVLPEKLLNVAFIYEGGTQDTEWNMLHDVGRTHVEENLAEKVNVHVYETKPDEQDYTNVIEQAIEEGSTVIFTTSAKMMHSAVRVAIANKKIRIFNCSLHYPYRAVRTYLTRNYEIKFLLGVIAGAVSSDDVIGYEADYPMYGVIANINAFALGVQLVRPNARVKLFWSGIEDTNFQKETRQIGLVCANAAISTKDEDKPFGLFEQTENGRATLASVEVEWGKFYERIIKLILSGDWDRSQPKDQRSLNYWWGVSAGVLNINCSDELPSGVRRLVNLVLANMRDGTFYPFCGEILDQDGIIHGEADKAMMVEEYVTMGWLCSNVDGRIPSIGEVQEGARNLIELQGIVVNNDE